MNTYFNKRILTWCIVKLWNYLSLGYWQIDGILIQLGYSYQRIILFGLLIFIFHFYLLHDWFCLCEKVKLSKVLCSQTLFRSLFHWLGRFYCYINVFILVMAHVYMFSFRWNNGVVYHVCDVIDARSYDNQLGIYF